jgi:hypothetical protein
MAALVVICLEASMAYSFAVPQEPLKFKLLILSNGVTKSGASWDGRIYETPTQIKVYLYMVHLGSREAAKKEYEDQLKAAVRIISQGKTQDKPTTEARAVITVSDTRECKEMPTVLATADTMLHIVQSCSPEAALEFEKQWSVSVR